MRRVRKFLKSLCDRLILPYTTPVERRLERIEQALDNLNHAVGHSNEQSTSAREMLTYIDTRTQSLHYQALELAMANEYQMDMFRRLYLETHPRRDNPFVPGIPSANLYAERLIADDSADHLMPESTVEGISRPTSFVNHIIDVLGNQISALDLGTGAAGFVFEMQQKGLTAYGVDGSDYCRLNGIGYWPLLDPYLFTCDITKPFRFEEPASKKKLSFELITAWEVLEHIPEQGIPGLLANIRSNLTENGYFIGSVSMIEYIAANGTPYHVSLFPKERWRDMFADNGLQMIDDSPLNPRLFYRGNGPRFQDRHNYFSNPNEGFHFVAVKS